MEDDVAIINCPGNDHSIAIRRVLDGQFFGFVVTDNRELARSRVHHGSYCGEHLPLLQALDARGVAYTTRWRGSYWQTLRETLHAEGGAPAQSGSA